jgi:molybdopterin/thiamine biosynthesis adenylyltransferase/rhodanese-related sulfurtransferase
MAGKSGREVLKDARLRASALEPDEVQAIIELAGTTPPVLLDVREGEEWRGGHLPGAVHLPRGYFELQVDEKLPDKDAPIIVYCAGGNRSALTAVDLEELGYTNVRHMSRGFSGWRAAGFPVEVPKQWTPAQRERYSRHFLLPEVGEAGQQKIANASVFVLGAGGLGAPALYYLAAAGVGRIGICDFDAVEASNLQRQIIHSTGRVGMNKAKSAQLTIEELNPDVEVTIFEERLTRDNVDALVAGYDIIIDATDNFATRYLLNDAAVRLGKPYIYGSIFRFEGYASVFWPAAGGPCYKCLYREAPPAALAPSCSEAGVLGVLPGIVGLIQANEALKIIVGYGDPLVGKLLVFDATATHFDELRVKPDPRCPACSAHRDEVLAASGGIHCR